MQKRVAVFVIIILVFVPFVYAGIYGVTIGSTDYSCEDKADVDVTTSDGICPSDYAGCGACQQYDDESETSSHYVDDPDCCSPMVCTTFWCTSAGEVCGDSTNESVLNETDSEGDTVDDTSPEDCSGTCTSGTENVIDDTNEPACFDTDYDEPDSCADDANVYSPITATSGVCSADISCHDTDDDGDYEVCSAGNWHDADEAEEYCTAVGGTWEIGTGTSMEYDDYNTDLTDGYCNDDDGYIINGAIVAEVIRSGAYCQAAAKEILNKDVTVKIVDAADTSNIIAEMTTTYESSWSGETIGCHEDATDNDVGSYSFIIPAGDYYLVAEADSFNTVTKYISVSADETYATLWMYLNEGCQSDCTMNDSVCHASCDGVNSCSFQTYEETGERVSTYCDKLRKGYRYILTEEEDSESNTVSGYEVYCCTGTPQKYEREYFSTEDAETNCVENIISKDKEFWLNGEFVTFHFVLFSDPDPTKKNCGEYEDFMCEMYGGGFCS